MTTHENATSDEPQEWAEHWTSDDEFAVKKNYPQRLIHVKTGGDHNSELMCEIHATTAQNEKCSLESGDYMLCFHEKRGYFLARQGLGTWMEQEPFEIMYDLKRQKQAAATNHDALVEGIKKIRDILADEEGGSASYCAGLAQQLLNRVRGM